MKTCSFEGCGRPFRAKGLCATHYSQRNYSPSGKTKPIRAPLTVDGFWKLVKKSDGCWTWLGHCHPRNRYGFGSGLGKESAHRHSWILANGDIPDGLHVLHKCDNPPCVRPDHLWLGTHADNVADMIAKNRGARGERQGHAKLTEKDVINIRKLSAGGASNIDLADALGVNRTTIHDVVKRRKWAHV